MCNCLTRLTPKLHASISRWTTTRVCFLRFFLLRFGHRFQRFILCVFSTASILPFLPISDVVVIKPCLEDLNTRTDRKLGTEVSMQTLTRPRSYSTSMQTNIAPRSEVHIVGYSSLVTSNCRQLDEWRSLFMYFLCLIRENLHIHPSTLLHSNYNSIKKIQPSNISKFHGTKTCDQSYLKVH
jgi:hypothetical protein